MCGCRMHFLFFCASLSSIIPPPCASRNSGAATETQVPPRHGSRLSSIEHRSHPTPQHNPPAAAPVPVPLTEHIFGCEQQKQKDAGHYAAYGPFHPERPRPSGRLRRDDIAQAGRTQSQTCRRSNWGPNPLHTLNPTPPLPPRFRTPQFKAIKPVGDRVLVKVDKEEAKSVGGVLLPASIRNKPNAGAIIALGDAKQVKVRGWAEEGVLAQGS